MAATIFSPPAHLQEPKWNDYGFDFAAFSKAEDDYLRAIQAWAKSKAKSKNPIVGEVFTYGVGDGYAIYVVFNTRPLQLIHVPIGDCWGITEVVRRGLRLSDIQESVERRKNLHALFGGVTP